MSSESCRTHTVRCVIVDGTAATTLMEKRPCIVHWIVAGSKKEADDFVLDIFDGFDDGGVRKFRASNVACRLYAFHKPIPCSQGLAVVNNNDLDHFTICWTVKGRTR